MIIGGIISLFASFSFLVEATDRFGNAYVTEAIFSIVLANAGVVLIVGGIILLVLRHWYVEHQRDEENRRKR